MKGISFEAGKRYLLEVNFGDPYQDFISLKRAFKSKFGAGLSLNLGELRVGGSLPDFGSRLSLGGLSEFGALGSLGEGSIFGKFPSLNISSSIQDNSFPPIYITACNRRGDVCRKSEKNKHLVLKLEFTAKKERRKFIPESMLYGKDSQLGESMPMRAVSDFPKFNCEFLNQNRNEEN
jgi:hypothetical protein